MLHAYDQIISSLQETMVFLSSLMSCARVRSLRLGTPNSRNLGKEEKGNKGRTVGVLCSYCAPSALITWSQMNIPPLLLYKSPLKDPCKTRKASMLTSEAYICGSQPKVMIVLKLLN